jgi:heavy metal sensor kinase
MKPRSLRARLALWQAGLLALTLLSLAGLTYLLLRQMLQSRADAGLEEYADNVARSIAASLYQASAIVPRQGPRSPGGLPRFLADDVRSWGRYVQVIDRRGNVIERSDALASHPLPVSADALRRGMRGITTFEQIEGLGEHPVRVVTVPVQMADEVPYLVQAGLSLEGVDATLQRASMILLILTPSVFVMALVGGWLLVGRALRPVEELTQTALELESRNLSRRIVPPVSDDEIGRLAAAFDQMLARLDRSFRQVQQFSADASHELKTPLTTIRGEAEVALMGERTPDEQRQALRTILEEAERMSAIVENLLMVARTESDRTQLHREALALDDLLLAAYEPLERVARGRSVTLEVGAIQEVEVLGDRLWLLQLVTNLLNNAIKYTPQGGLVQLSLARDDGYAVIRVRDNGIGISAEHLPHIFDRFYRVDEGRSRESGGTGLGLSIARWVAESHGGTIEVDSQPGVLTEFRVRLPLAGG